MNRRIFLLLALGTLLLLGGLGVVLVPLARDVNIFIFLRGHATLYTQLIVGVLSGMAVALLAWQLINIPYLSATRDFFKQIITGLKMNTVQIVFVSLCAGIGEELLFRGAIQPVAGIWITSVIFVAVHGYLNPYNLKISLYGVFMTFSIVYIGYLTERFGILSSMVAHSIIDIYLLQKLSA